MFRELREGTISHMYRSLWYLVTFVFAVTVLIVLTESSRRAFSNGYSNHWGFDTLLLACLCIVPILWALVGLVLHPRPWRAVIILGVIACVTMICLFLFQHYNVLVNYDTWLERGMPVKWIR